MVEYAAEGEVAVDEVGPVVFVVGFVETDGCADGCFVADFFELGFVGFLEFC